MEVTPKDRPKTVRQRVFDLVKDAPAHTLFTYSDLSEAMDRDARKARGAIEGASKDLFKSRGVGLVCVRGSGYQLMHPDQAPLLMRTKVRRASGQIQRGQFIGEHVDTLTMSEDARRIFTPIAHEVAVLGTEMKQVQRRLDFHANTLAAVIERVTQLETRDADLTEEELGDLRDMLAKARNKKDLEAASSAT